MQPIGTPETVNPQPDPRSVFVVHGRNLRAKDAVVNFLRSADLKPITWEQATEKAMKVHKDANPYIGQILDAGFGEARAVVVIFTGDDMARLSTRYGEEGLTPQARPNVYFEAGIASGRDPQRTVFIQIGPVRGMSDIGGRHLIDFDGTVKPMRDLLARLRDCGCNINDKLANLQPLGPELCEPEPESKLEISRRRFMMVRAAFLLSGLIVGVLGSALWPILWPNEIAFNVTVKTSREAVTAYLAVDHSHKVASGNVELRLRRYPSYIVLYEVEKKLLQNDPVKPGQPLRDFNVDEAYLIGSECPEDQVKVRPKIVIRDEQIGASR